MNEDLLAQLIPGLVVEMLFSGLGLIVGVVAALLLIQSRRVPAIVTAIGAGAPALGPVVVALLYVGGDDPLAGAVTTAGAAFVGGLSTVGIVGITGLLLAFAGARRAPRRWRLFGLGLVGAIGVAVLAVMAGIAVENTIFGNVRAVVYLALGLLLAIGMLGGGEDAGLEVSSGAALTLPLLVAAGEAAERGMVHLILLQRLPEVPADQREEMVRRFLEAFAPELLWGSGALLVASSVAFLTVLLRAESGRARPVGCIASAAWISVGFFILYGPGLGENALIEVVGAMSP